MKHPCHLPDPFSVTFSLNSPLITYFNKPERTTLKDVRHSSKVPTGEFADTVIDSACVICYDKEADTMVLPCGHTVVCWTCYTLLEKSCEYRTCVQCLQPVERAVLVLD
jgi:hypothetical protein